MSGFFTESKAEGTGENKAEEKDKKKSLIRTDGTVWHSSGAKEQPKTEESITAKILKTYEESKEGSKGESKGGKHRSRKRNQKKTKKNQRKSRKYRR